MPAKKGGKGQKAKKKGGNFSSNKRQLDLKEEGQEYALVTRMLGNGRLEAQCYDGKIRKCRIRGSLMKRVWIANGDTILLGLRDFEDDKADVIHKYTPDEVRTLVSDGHIPERIDQNEEEERDENTQDQASRFISFENI